MSPGAWTGTPLYRMWSLERCYIVPHPSQSKRPSRRLSCFMYQRHSDHEQGRGGVGPRSSKGGIASVCLSPGAWTLPSCFQEQSCWLKPSCLNVLRCGPAAFFFFLFNPYIGKSKLNVKEKSDSKPPVGCEGPPWVSGRV